MATLKDMHTSLFCLMSMMSWCRRRRRRSNNDFFFAILLFFTILLTTSNAEKKRFLSPVEESLLDGIECLPNGSICDLVQLVVIPQATSNKTITSSLASATKYSTSTDIYKSTRQKTKYNTRVLFIAFGRVFDVLLKKENSKTCFYSGHLVGKKHSTKAHLNLCGGVSGRIELASETYLIVPDENEEYIGKSHAIEDQKDSHEKNLFRIYKSKLLTEDLNFENVVKGSTDFSILNVPVISQLPSDRWRRSHKPQNLPDPEWPPKSNENWLEIMVVADGPMLKYHGDKLRNYILTLMQIVSKIYLDASLGNRIRLSVSHLLILREGETFAPSNGNPKISASEMLKEFCKWQAKQNTYSKTGPELYDVALLLTRENICRNPTSPDQNNCDTLGLAELGTMCGKHSCAVVQDNGLSAAFTIAHELGHVLNMPHDDDQKCSSYSTNSSTSTKVMSRMLDHNTNPWEWSQCSSRYVTGFLDGNYGRCLLNKPGKNELDWFKSASQYPGQHFDENRQCEFVFGNGSKICSYMPPCKRLWCTTSEGEANGCRTQHMPWADGTPCGKSKWCMKSECVSKLEKIDPPIHGHWGEWSSWSTCSRSCGGGIRRSERYCDTPSPENGGLYCVGDRKRYESCDTWDCPRGANDYRLEQCQQYNGNSFTIQGIPDDVQWVPKYAGIRGPDKCKLFCRVEQSSAYYLLGASVADGTPCGADTFDTCVNGQCIPAGCDHVLGSGKTLDWCGICGGNNSTCREERGVYNKTEYGYNTVVRIPGGANNIEILQYGFGRNSKDDTYIALKDVDTDEYILNGDFVMSMFRKTIQYGGITLEYSGSDASVERINSSKPLKKDLMVEVLIVGNLYPPQVHYSYAISKAGEESFKWKILPKWSICDKICQGKQFSHPVCVQIHPGHDIEVEEEKCSYLPRPRTESKDCNLHCRLEWQLKSRTSCSSKCGPGTQTLTHSCIRFMANEQEEGLSDHYCFNDTRLVKPAQRMKCEGPCEGVKWSYGDWSSCSVTCGGGWQKREGLCVDSDGKILPQEKCSAIEAVLGQECATKSCPKWQTGDWTSCNETCGAGNRQRPYWCEEEGKQVDGKYCAGEKIPQHIEVCVVKPCTSWFTGSWTECSESCKRERDVYCRDEKTQSEVSPNLCARAQEPESQIDCDRTECERTDHNMMQTKLSNLDAKRKLRPDDEDKSRESNEDFSAKFNEISRTSKPKTKTTNEISKNLNEVFDEKNGYDKDGRDKNGFDKNNGVDESGDKVSTSFKSKSGLSEIQDRVKYRWKVGAWRTCSSSCGTGTQDRPVACVDTMTNAKVQPSRCKIFNSTPKSKKGCILPPCSAEGKFIVGVWSPCSVTCGKGIQTRSVSCVDKTTGQLLDDTSCTGDKTPSEVSEQICVENPVCLHELPQSSHVEHDHDQEKDTLVHWRKGVWSECSRTCGGGVRHRVVVCQDNNGDSSRNCDTSKMPPSEISCNSEPCPRWNFGEWAECDKPCEGGVQNRLVRCQDHLGQTVRDVDCGLEERPPNSIKCNTQPCKQSQPKYHWTTSKWSQCSKSCDAGLATRHVECVNMNANGRVVDESFCQIAASRRQSRLANRRRKRQHQAAGAGQRRFSLKPKTTKKCNKFPCPYQWVPGPWSECTHTCGKGVRHRRVACHRVNTYNWIDPDPVPHGCNNTIKPSDFQTCIINNLCSTRVLWKVGPWSPCAWDGKGCGKRGKERREVDCVDYLNRKVRKNICNRQLTKKPKKSRKCGRKICGYENCLDMKVKTGLAMDGEYQILFAGKNVSIYCHGMNSSMPEEFVSLPTGEQENYSEIYGMRLIQPNTCPNNGTRDPRCDCVPDAQRREGLTVFHKIKVNVTSLKVNTHDFTFATQIRGQQVPFGEAGDCYSTANCPQGVFSINLTGTGLRVSPYTGWVGQGNRPSLWLQRVSENQVLQGKCGGYCGTCVPEPHHGLKLDLLPP